jgi:hypothetical protein
MMNRLKALLGLMRGAPKELRAPRDSPKVWITIRIGQYRSHEEYRAAFERAGLGICDVQSDNDQANLAEAFTSFAQQEADIDLVVRTVKGLGLKSGASYSDIRARALSEGLIACPAEVFLALALAYPAPMRGLDDVLYIAIDGERFQDLPWIYGLGSPDYFKRNARFVFMKPRR